MSAPQILVVCTGNVCRSPLVERLLQQALDERYGPGAVGVASAGTGALAGYPMDERAAAVLTELGGDPDGFIARRLTPEMVRSAALVLTATRDHRGQVVRAHPRALRRAFTVRELAAILAHVGDHQLPAEDDPARQLAALTQLGTLRRGLHRPASPEDDDVVDPFRRGDEVYHLMREQVSRALPQLLRGLGA